MRLTVAVLIAAAFAASALQAQQVRVPWGQAPVVASDSVTRPAMWARGLQPVYPPTLKAAGVKGDVLVSFVVDTLGRADTSTVQVLQSAHPLFTAAVRVGLTELRYFPAQVGRRKVAVRVQQTFTFSANN